MSEESPTILVVDDEEGIREAISQFLGSQGYATEDCESAEEALEKLQRGSYALIVTDMKLPGIDGIEFSKRVKKTAADSSIVVITAYGNIPNALEAIRFGADDYLLKPFTLQALDHSVRKVLEKRRLESENIAYRAELRRKVKQRAEGIQLANYRLGETFYKTVHIFGNALESRETYLYGRTERITIMALDTATALGWGSERLSQILLGAPISDIGKLALPEAVLYKAGPITAEERALLRSHAREGARIVGNLADFSPVIPIIRLHHERLDGSGYPDGLEGDEIPACARLVAICDSFDAMIHARPWRPALGADEATGELRRLAGTAYDKEMVEAFLESLRDNDFLQHCGKKPTRLFYDLTLPRLARDDVWPA